MIQECECGSTIHARGLCIRCYTHKLKNGEIERFLGNNRKYPYPETGDPHIVWFFKEMVFQNLSMEGVASHAGISPKVLQSMKRTQKVNFFTFKIMLEVLGYEIMIVAKEPKDA